MTKDPDALVDAFKARLAAKAEESQPKEVRFDKAYPVIGAEFEIAYTAENGLPAKAVIVLSYVNKGKGRLTFEFKQS